MHGMPKIPDLEPNQTMMTRLQLQKQKKIPAKCKCHTHAQIGSFFGHNQLYQMVSKRAHTLFM